jgi:hypothetical protein
VSSSAAAITTGSGGSTTAAGSSSTTVLPLSVGARHQLYALALQRMAARHTQHQAKALLDQT